MSPTLIQESSWNIKFFKKKHPSVTGPLKAFPLYFFQTPQEILYAPSYLKVSQSPIN